MASKEFAPGWPRNEQGWIEFPNSDRADRVKLFGEEVMGHPAMLNLNVQQSIIDYVSNEGDTLLDPMSGSGTIMLAALFNRNVVCIELEEHYHQLQQQVKARLAYEPSIADRILLLYGDCRQILPIPCNHIISSPPYSGAMDVRRVRKAKEDSDNYFAEQDARMVGYSKSPNNLSKLNTFIYNQQMERIYKLCYQSVLPGGTMTIIIKDRVEDGKRVWLSNWVVQVCYNAGFILQDWFKWAAGGTMFTRVRRSKGELTVDTEEILVFRRN